MLSKRATLDTDVQDILDARTKDWGIEVSAVEIRDIQLPIIWSRLSQTGRSRTRSARKGHPRGGGVPSGSDAHERRDDPCFGAGGHAAALFADANGGRRRE